MKPHQPGVGGDDLHETARQRTLRSSLLLTVAVQTGAFLLIAVVLRLLDALTDSMVFGILGAWVGLTLWEIFKQWQARHPATHGRNPTDGEVDL